MVGSLDHNRLFVSHSLCVPDKKRQRNKNGQFSVHSMYIEKNESNERKTKFTRKKNEIAHNLMSMNLSYLFSFRNLSFGFYLYLSQTFDTIPSFCNKIGALNRWASNYRSVLRIPKIEPTKITRIPTLITCGERS